MAALIPIGVFFTLAGLLGLGWCIREAIRARREETEDAKIKARLQKVVAVNLGALGVSAIGLMLVVVGVFLT